MDDAWDWAQDAPCLGPIALRPDSAESHEDWHLDRDSGSSADER
jgi:hypothetical protein